MCKWVAFAASVFIVRTVLIANSSSAVEAFGDKYIPEELQQFVTLSSVRAKVSPQCSGKGYWIFEGVRQTSVSIGKAVHLVLC
jgi:hypothetical protein